MQKKFQFPCWWWFFCHFYLVAKHVPVIRKITFLDFVQLQMVMSVNCQRWKQVLPVCVYIDKEINWVTKFGVYCFQSLEAWHATPSAPPHLGIFEVKKQETKQKNRRNSAQFGSFLEPHLNACEKVSHNTIHFITLKKKKKTFFYCCCWGLSFVVLHLFW